MIYDKIENIKKYPQIPADAAEFINSLSEETETGRYTLASDNYVNIEEYYTKAEKDCRLEAHKQYTDIQIILSGKEILEYTGIEGLDIDEVYDKSRDITFFKTPDRKLNRVILGKGYFALLYPHEAHQPQMNYAAESLKVKKAVVKIKSKQDIEFRKVTSAQDIEYLANLGDKIWREHYIDINSIDCIEYMLKKFQSKEAITAQLTNENYEYYFIMYRDSIAGYIGIQPHKQELFLSKLYIDIPFRGYSLGRRAFEFIKQKAEVKNLPQITLRVNKKNYNTIDIYKHLGFRIKEAVVTDIGGGYVMDDYIMEYKIKK